MRRLQKLRNLSTYFQTFSLPGTECSFKHVTAQGDATTKLDKATGIQVLFARPEYREIGQDQDTHKAYVDTAIFVLAKDLGSSKTEAKENAQYAELENVVEAVLHRIDEDVTSGGCVLLSGFVMSSIRVTPEPLIFGGWCGYSIDLSFE